MQVLRSVVGREMLRNGGLPVCGVVEFDRGVNRCFLLPDRISRGEPLSILRVVHPFRAGAAAEAGGPE
jgi:hypothetical protein